MFNLIRRIRPARLRSIVEEQRDFYAKPRPSAEIRASQLEIFNQVWASIAETVPFYAALVRERKLPRSFASWEVFRESVPITDRTFVQERSDQLLDQRRPSDFMRTTGGSTSEPVQLPSWRSELAYANADLWLARGWFGIDPG